MLLKNVHRRMTKKTLNHILWLNWKENIFMNSIYILCIVIYQHCNFVQISKYVNNSSTKRIIAYMHYFLSHSNSDGSGTRNLGFGFWVLKVPWRNGLKTSWTRFIHFFDIFDDFSMWSKPKAKYEEKPWKKCLKPIFRLIAGTRSVITRDSQLTGNRVPTLLNR